MLGAVIVFIMYTRKMRETARPPEKIELNIPRDVTLSMPVLDLTEDDPAVAETEFTNNVPPPLPRLTPSRGAAVAVRDSLIDMDELPEFSVLNGAARQDSEDFVPRRTSVPMLISQPISPVSSDVVSPSTTGAGSVAGATISRQKTGPPVAGQHLDTPTRRRSAQLQLADDGSPPSDDDAASV